MFRLQSTAARNGILPCLTDFIRLPAAFPGLAPVSGSVPALTSLVASWCANDSDQTNPFVQEFKHPDIHRVHGDDRPPCALEDVVSYSTVT